MTRKIKFRAWHKERKRMYWFDVVWGQKHSIQGTGWIGMLELDEVDPDLRKAIDPIECEFLQFTGLLDKNGKEIYEGDLMQYKYYNVYKRWWSNLEQIPVIEEECKKQREDINIHQPVEVVFRDGLFRLDWSITGDDIARGQRFKRGQSHSCDTEEKQFDFEVIGNIYENPYKLPKDV